MKFLIIATLSFTMLACQTAPKHQNKFKREIANASLFRKFIDGIADSSTASRSTIEKNVIKFIQKEELENLYLGILTITLEQALRFFTDYLEGDQYYKITHPNHNLERARNQIALVKSIENNKNNIKNSISTYFAKSL